MYLTIFIYYLFVACNVIYIYIAYAFFKNYLQLHHLEILFSFSFMILSLMDRLLELYLSWLGGNLKWVKQRSLLTLSLYDLLVFFFLEEMGNEVGLGVAILNMTP